MIEERQLVAIFCEIDDFCKDLDKHFPQPLLEKPLKGKRGPQCSLALSEVMAILICFQMVGYKNFKTFYCGFLCKYWRDYFPLLPSYNRFVELMKNALLPLTLFVQLRAGKKTGIYYIDSTCLPVCHMKRTKRHKVFDAIAELERTSVGWFMGLKLHLVINHQGELVAFKITKGNYHDSKAAPSLFSGLKGLAFGDKGYLGKKIFEALMGNGLKLVTRIRKNMKKTLQLSNVEKQLLNSRGIIETVIGSMKHKYQIWHTRHRSPVNALTHLIAGLAAYVIEPLKISAIKLLTDEPLMIN